MRGRQAFRTRNVESNTSAAPFAAANSTVRSVGEGSARAMMLPAVVGSSRVPQPPLHGRRAKPSVRRVVSTGRTADAWNERPSWAHQMVSDPIEATGLKRCQRSTHGPEGRPGFTLQTQVNLRRPTEPRPYRQKQAIPRPLPFSDTIVLANLDARKARVAPPKYVQAAIESWQVVWNTPRVNERQVTATSETPRFSFQIVHA